jgi:zinc/manganese transport system ATP-binding protein
MHSKKPHAIRVENLTLSYRHHPAVHHLSCAFEAGSLTAVVGPNGAGKSTLLQALAGLIKPSTGSLHMPHATYAGRAKVAYLPQQADIDRSFPLRVLDLVLLGAWPQLGAFRGAGAAQRKQALQALGAVRLHGFEQRLIGELSVGQFQRVLFARLMLQDAPLILLDEPFAAIDSRTTADLMAVVRGWHAEQRTVIAVLHDLEQVRAHFPHTLLLAREGIAHGVTAQALSAANLALARRMAERWDDSAPWCGEPAPGSGAAPHDGRDTHVHMAKHAAKHAAEHAAKEHATRLAA